MLKYKATDGGTTTHRDQINNQKRVWVGSWENLDIIDYLLGPEKPSKQHSDDQTIKESPLWRVREVVVMGKSRRPANKRQIYGSPPRAVSAWFWPNFGLNTTGIKNDTTERARERAAGYGKNCLQEKYGHRLKEYIKRNLTGRNSL